ncbi:MAG: hypothetical protein RBS68_06005 [Anaerolineales bacterium]|jgi:hypothetical protein|nr:hypothetical protein [Anaerolineales bacterium]
MTEYADDEIRIPVWIWGSILAAIIFLVLGYVFSPRDRDNRPILLLPGVKAVEDYRVALVRWQTQARELDSQISTILSGQFGSDLFATSREAQKMIDAGVRLISGMEQKKTPIAATPARAMALRMASEYLEAARATLVWTTTPTEDNLNKAQGHLSAARILLSELEASEWTTPR